MDVIQHLLLREVAKSFHNLLGWFIGLVLKFKLLADSVVCKVPKDNREAPWTLFSLII